MLPVSSSTHLLVFSRLQDLPNQRLSFDVFLNIGSLLAVSIFFWREIFGLVKGGADFVCNKKSQNRDFFLTIVIANIPTIVLFGLADAFLDINFHSPLILASSMIIFALIMWWCDRKEVNKIGNEAEVSRKDAVLTGIAQVCAIVPGVSRLGACYSALRYLNYSRQAAFRFSMILSLLPVAGACFLRALKIFMGHAAITESWTLVSVGCIFSFFFGLITLSLVDSFFRKHSAFCFVIYRIIFGIFILTQDKIF